VLPERLPGQRPARSPPLRRAVTKLRGSARFRRSAGKSKRHADAALHNAWHLGGGGRARTPAPYQGALWSAATSRRFGLLAERAARGREKAGEKL